MGFDWPGECPYAIKYTIGVKRKKTNSWWILWGSFGHSDFSVSCSMIELNNGVGISRQPGLKLWQSVKQNSLAGQQDQ
jgi:hypothetical protein